MAIRQEEYWIYSRVNFTVAGNLKIYADKKTKYYMPNPLIKDSQGGCNHSLIEQNNDGDDSGLWELVFKSSSIEQTRAKYKELLQTIGQDYLKVEKRIPKDIMVTPIS